MPRTDCYCLGVSPQTNPLSPQVTLATSVHAQPGVYALLVGSGVSTGAGIPTGWGVVKELIRRLATAAQPDEPEAGDKAAKDPDAWWAENGDGHPLGYSNLLAAMASTQAARRNLLATFFEPSEEDAESGLKVPSEAHRAIAQLVKRGSIRVILTTNFDRLLERALEEAGVSPQVIARPEAVQGATPLTHAAATVVKLHGDYADLEIRNTVDELATYPPEWDRLLDRVFDEYGLVIAGWSADWDRALVSALERQTARRYPLYWDSRSSKGETATRLLAFRGGAVVQSTSADVMFGDLLSRLEALDRLAEPPLSTALAVTRLKRYLLDDTKRIDLFDLLDGRVSRLVATVQQGLPVMASGEPEGVQRTHDEVANATLPLISLAAVGAFHDHDNRHADLWVQVVQRLLAAKRTPEGNFSRAYWDLKHLPALLVWRTLGLMAVERGNDALLLRLFTEPSWRDPFGMNEKKPALQTLGDFDVLDFDTVQSFPRWGGTRWFYPLSHYLRWVLREPLRDFAPDDEQYRWLNDRYEYRRAVAEFVRPGRHHWQQSTPGLFIGERSWTSEGRTLAEVEFVESVKADGGNPWNGLLEPLGGVDAVAESLRAPLAEMSRRHG